MSPRWQWAVVTYLVLWAVCMPGCAHRYASSENRYLQESERIKWDETAEKHDVSEQRNEQQRNERTVVIRRKTTPSPAGPIVEEEYALTLSELRDTSAVVTASDSRLAIEAEREKAKKAGSNKNVAAETKAGWPSPLWLLLLVPVAVGGWALKRYWRSLIPRWL